jgi:DNA-binding beta-propeller fold protein YncE
MDRNGTFRVFRASDMTIEDSAAIGVAGYRVAFNPNGQYIYIGFYDQEKLLVVRTSDYTVVATLRIATSGMCLSPDGSFLYVGNMWDETLIVVRTSDHTVVSTIPLTDYVDRLSVTPGGSLVYFSSDHYGGKCHGVLRASDNSVRGFFPTGWSSIAFTPDMQTAYCVGGTSAIVLTP